MLRFLAGAAACFLLMTGAFLLWQSRAASNSGLPAAPPPRLANAAPAAGQSWYGGGVPLLAAPEASPRSREEKRFARYDKDKNGKVEAAEYLAARKRNFDKLDLDHNGGLSFQEYAIKGIQKFAAAGGRKGWLSPAEFVRTAPPPPNHKRCSCNARIAPQVASADDVPDTSN